MARFEQSESLRWSFGKLALTARLFLGALLLFTALSKARSPDSSLSLIESMVAWPGSVSTLVLWCLIAVEIVVGTGLLFSLGMPWIWLVATALFAMFAVASVALAAVGFHGACGCGLPDPESVFGRVARPTMLFLICIAAAIFETGLFARASQAYAGRALRPLG